MQKRNQKAFTLVEILIASSILSMFMFTSYKLYFGVAKSFQKGSWSLNAQNKVRNALTFVREEMQKASFKTEVTLTRIDGNETLNPFKLNSATEITTSDTIATWFICLPFVAHDPTIIGAVYECELKLENGALIYTKLPMDAACTDETERRFTKYIVLKNISRIKLEVKDFDINKTIAGKVINIEIEVRHPDTVRFGNTHVISHTGAKVEMTVVSL